MSKRLNACSFFQQSCIGVLILCLCLAGALWADDPVNVALHKPYTFSKAPNYGLCTDPGDAQQLTDGILIHGSGGDYWGSKSAVGWTRTGTGMSITVDLGQVESIGGISFRSASGPGSTVAYPAFIYFWVSNDGETFTQAGELISASWAHGLPDGRGDPHLPISLPTGYHRYFADDLRLSGRFVKLTAYPAGEYLFSDEIEVFRGDSTRASTAAGAVALNSDFEDWAARNKYHAIAQVRMLYDLQELQHQPQADQFVTEIDSLRNEVLNMPRIEKLDMSRGLPYTPLHGRIWALNGPIQQAGGAAGVLSVGGGTLPTIPSLMMPRRLRAAPSPSTSCKTSAAPPPSTSPISPAKPCSATIRAADGSATPGPPTMSSCGRVRFHRDSTTRHCRRPPCPKQSKSGPQPVGRVDLPAGVTSQLWLTAQPRENPRGCRYSAVLTVTDCRTRHEHSTRRRHRQ